MKIQLVFLRLCRIKLLWAISEQTAAELIYRRVDASLPLLGMQSYDKKNFINIKKVRCKYCKKLPNENEIKLLGLLVEQFLAFAETMAQQHTQRLEERLDVILKMNGRELLTHAGEISHKTALEKSLQEYKKYKEKQKQVEKDASFKELEQDIKKLKK